MPPVVLQQVSQGPHGPHVPHGVSQDPHWFSHGSHVLPQVAPAARSHRAGSATVAVACPAAWPTTTAWLVAVPRAAVDPAASARSGVIDIPAATTTTNSAPLTRAASP